MDIPTHEQLSEWLRALLANSDKCFRCRPYYVENTGSLPNSEVKRRKARLVLGSGTAWEPLRVLTAFFPAHFSPFPHSLESLAAR